MKYAEAVKRMAELVGAEPPLGWSRASKEDQRNNEALSVLRRAEGVMGAVESEGEDE